MITHSIRFKTSVLYSGVLSVILAAFSIYLFDTTRQILYGEARRDLRVKAGEIEAFLDAYASISSPNNASAFLMDQFLSSSDENISGKSVIDQLWDQDSKSLGLGSDYFRILSPRGRVRLRSENMGKDIETVFNTQFPSHPAAVCFTRLQFGTAAFYGISYPFRFANRNSFVIQLATPMVSVYRVLSQLVIFIVIGIVVILFMTLFMGSFLTRRILKPVTDVTAAANNISQTNLQLRIPRQKLDHEMHQLVDSFNRMIERLEQSFAHVNEFSSQVAHELKTPLAIVKSELELALLEGKSIGDTNQSMKIALGEVERLIKIIKDMLLLAKLEYKLNIFKMEDIDIIQFLKELNGHAGVLAAQKHITLDLSVPSHSVILQGDVVHLRRVFFNLLHNAVKFTPPDGTIKILAEVRLKQIFISIKDTGIGIGPADKPHIFEKFYRIRHPDLEDMGGSGLGLCMARAVARIHGGDIVFDSEWGQGSTFTVILPIE